MRERLSLAADALVPVASLLVLIPVVDCVSSVWPVQPGNIVWRFGAAGLLSVFLLLPLVGLALLTVLAALSERAAPHLVLAVMHAAGTLS